jgi:hypothetical protein
LRRAGTRERAPGGSSAAADDTGPRDDVERSGTVREGVLRLRGTAVVRRGAPSLGELIRIGLKDYLAPGGLRSELANLERQRVRQRYYGQSQPAVIEVTPYSAELLPRPG